MFLCGMHYFNNIVSRYRTDSVPDKWRDDVNEAPNVRFVEVQWYKLADELHNTYARNRVYEEIEVR